MPRAMAAQAADRHASERALLSQFNSQPPAYYPTAHGRLDRPRGYGKVATFHYVKASMMTQATAEEHYLALWQLSRAGATKSDPPAEPTDRVYQYPRWR